MKRIEIWMEGYIITGSRQEAQRIWEGEAESFEQAIEKYVIEHDVRELTVTSGTRLHERPIYCIFGCRLFDNEADARVFDKRVLYGGPLP